MDSSPIEHFRYDTAFNRNIGWVTPEEQRLLRCKRVAIAGLGGVGGSHLLALARLGIGAFNLADPDTFELANFNRQAGATLTHIGQQKVRVLSEMARAINPELEIRDFPEGVTEQNLDQFLRDVDIYVDGLDFFAVSARRMVFAACAERGIPAITAAPLGTGVALLNFLPGKMTFEAYFQLEGHSEDEQLIRFLLGLSPAMLQRRYLVYPDAVDLNAHRGPSTVMACEICAGVAATQALKILLQRGRVRAAPHGLQFDPFRNKLTHTWRPGGNRNPIHQLGLHIAKRQLARFRQGATAQPSAAKPRTAIEHILDLARWAPSGDNTQPWRFEIKSDTHLVVHGFDTRDHCVYDLRGHASHIALGALLETISIAASEQGLRTQIERQRNAAEPKPAFDVRFKSNSLVDRDPLLPYIRIRTTQRRPMRNAALTARQKEALTRAVGSEFTVQWLEGRRDRGKVARLLFLNGKLRLTLPEAYETHRTIIEWNSRFSADRIPDHAVGMDPLGVKLMRWGLQSWERVHFLNRYLAGTLLPRVQLDLIPALACAAHYVIVASRPAETIDDYIAAGRAWQRFWLTATQQGLWGQPEMTPLIFDQYVRDGVSFSNNERSRRLANLVSDRLSALLSPEVSRKTVVMGRLGTGPAPTARSVRLPLEELMLPAGDSQG